MIAVLVTLVFSKDNKMILENVLLSYSIHIEILFRGFCAVFRRVCAG